MGSIAQHKRLRVRRRRTGETDYRRRLKLLRGERPRAVVRVTNTQVICQLVAYSPDGDAVISAVNGRSLVSRFGWPADLSRKSVPACYVAGYALGKFAVAGGHEGAVLDIGLASAIHGGRLFAALKGMVDAGLDVPHGEDILHSEGRLSGAHLGDGLDAAVAAAKARIDEVVA